MPEIVLLRGQEVIARIRVGEANTRIGRQADSDLVIPSSRVSRRHARVVRQQGSYVLQDCDSGNGCYLGNHRVREHVLAHGDMIRIADYDLLFLNDGDSSPSSESPLERESRFGSAVGSDDWTFLQAALADPKAARRDADRLQCLFEISRALEGARDFSSVLSQIMDQAIRIMGGERGLLMLADGGPELQVHTARDLDGDISGIERETVSCSLMRQVMATGRAILIHDAQSEEWGTKSVLAHSIHSAICAPLKTREVVTGVLYVDHRSRQNAFTEQDLAFFTTFAIQSKAAIDSSRTYWELVDSLFRASDDFIVVCSPTGEISQANRTAAELVGLSADEMRSRPLSELIVPKDRERATALCRDTLVQGTVSAQELRLIGKEGNAIPLSVSSFALRDRAGDPIGQCLIGRDLSEVKYLIEQLELHNRFIRKTFGRYLSDEIVSSLLASPDGLKLGGEQCKVTIMMSDLRAFTSLSERLPAEQVVRLLNNYLAAMIEIITRYQGTIDEFIGDAILVIFGAPHQRPDDAVRAAACAIEMQLAMQTVNEWNRAHGLPALEMGIALNTGDVVVGNIGSKKRSKYAVVGRQVNVTARIESNTVGGQVLISASTLAEAPELLSVGERIKLSVKGIESLVTVHDLVAVGEPYHLALLPDDDPLIELASLLPIHYRKLEKNNLRSRPIEAQIVRLGKTCADLRASRRPPPLANLKLYVPAPEGGEPLEGFYCKVIASSDSMNSDFRVRFTAASPEVEELFSRLRQGL